MKPSLLLTTAALAIVTAAANLYASLRTGYSFPMAPLAAIVAGLILRGDTRSRTAIVAVAAGASAAGYVPGGGNVPALVVLAPYAATLSRGGWVVWFIFVSLLGLFAAAWLGAPKDLAFPTAKATADIADAMDTHASRGRSRALMGGVVAGVVVTLLHAVKVLPARLALPGRLGIELSALAFGIGPYVGVRVAASMAFAGVFTAAFVGPRLVSAGLVADPGWVSVVRFMLWPALGMVTTSACVAHVLEWKSARTAAPALKDTVARRTRAPSNRGHHALVALRGPNVISITVRARNPTRPALPPKRHDELRSGSRSGQLATHGDRRSSRFWCSSRLATRRGVTHQETSRGAERSGAQTAQNTARALQPFAWIWGDCTVLFGPAPAGMTTNTTYEPQAAPSAL